MWSMPAEVVVWLATIGAVGTVVFLLAIGAAVPAVAVETVAPGVPPGAPPATPSPWYYPCLSRFGFVWTGTGDRARASRGVARLAICLWSAPWAGFGGSGLVGRYRAL